MVAVKNCNCPYCDKHLDSASSLEDATLIPTAGDVSVCIGCAEVVVFAENGGLRKPTSEESNEHSEDKDLQTALYSIQRMRARHILMTGGN